MEIASKNKWQLRLAVLGIFALGFVAGALSLNMYRSFQFRRIGYQQMLDRLQLTGEQRKQVDQIFAEARTQMMDVRERTAPQMREIRERTDQRLRVVLTPEQWDNFKKMREEMGPWRRRRGRGGLRE
jgi:Spy/CpxP family protein refolding chaperone